MIVMRTVMPSAVTEASRSKHASTATCLPRERVSKKTAAASLVEAAACRQCPLFAVGGAAGGLSSGAEETEVVVPRGVHSACRS